MVSGSTAPVKPRQEWRVSLDQYLAWMKVQHEAGKIFFRVRQRTASTASTRSGRRRENKRKKIAASDPYTAAGFTAFELLEWEVHQIMGVGLFTSAELSARGKAGDG